MKKHYTKPEISILPTRCHVSTFQSEVPEDFNPSRRSLLIKGGLFASVGHITLLAGSNDDSGPKSNRRLGSTPFNNPNW